MLNNKLQLKKILKNIQINKAKLIGLSHFKRSWSKTSWETLATWFLGPRWHKWKRR